jgi:Rha family phage regulatory protein
MLDMPVKPSTDIALVVHATKPMADSREVAAKFGKQHAHVLRSIDNLLKSKAIQKWMTEIIQMEEFDAQANKPVRYFLLSQKAFLLVVGRFTGEKPIEQQMAYAEAFEAMAEALAKSQSIEKPLSHAERIIATGQALLAIEQGHAVVAARVDGVERRLDRIETAENWFTCIGFAKCFHDRSLSTNEASQLSRKAASIAAARHVQRGTVPDPRWGKVFSYPKEILAVAWPLVFGGGHA